MTSLATESLLPSGKVFIQNINQVLDIKFMHICCNWTNNWLVHVTSTQMNFGLLLHVPCNQSLISFTHSCAIELWICDCFSCNVIAIEMCDGLSLLSIRAGLLMITICCDPTTIVDWGVGLTTTLLLKYPCNNKMKRRLSTWLLHKLNCEF